MELEGIEPSSKQAAQGLSTCLSFGWFSKYSWQKADPEYSYFLWFSTMHRNSASLNPAFAMFPSVTAGSSYQGNSTCLISKIKQLVRIQKSCQLLWRWDLDLRANFSILGMLTIQLSCCQIRSAPVFLFAKIAKIRLSCSKDVQIY